MKNRKYTFQISDEEIDRLINDPKFVLGNIDDYIGQVFEVLLKNNVQIELFVGNCDVSFSVDEMYLFLICGTANEETICKFKWALLRGFQPP